ncbi:MAG TPA: hypothetical protein DIC36_00820 [Gammaproteobacteria bacterium]|nr:hypothetical protein [Gammaproteobacteria bacterium]
MKHFLMLLTAGLMGSLVLSTPLSAADFAERGKIDVVNLKASYVVVDDSKYMLSDNIKVHYQEGQVASVSALRRGMKIAFNVIGQIADSRGGSPAITELVILSSNR